MADEPRAGDKPEQIVARCLRDFEEDERIHNGFVMKLDARYKAYRGFVEISSEAAAWTSKHAPKYVLQVIETMVANMLDPTPSWRLRARPRFDTMAEVERYVKGARANELLLAEQLECDHYAEKQRAYGLQGLIAGLSVKKNSWNWREGYAHEQRVVPENILDAYGNVIGSVPRLRPMRRLEALRDDPTTEVVNVRDFIWHQAAPSLAKALRVTHRIWISFDELKDMECKANGGRDHDGPCEGGVYHNVDDLKDSRDQSASLQDRGGELHDNADRTKDMIEVLEQWCERGRRVVSIGNRKVLLRDAPNPFHFERLEHPYPFVVCSAMPDLFQIPGISEVEVMQDIQELLWALLRQQIDDVQLLSNVIMLVQDDVDTRGFTWAPGEYWSVPDLNSVKPLEINPVTAEIATNTITRLKDDLQNIPGASPTLLGQVDPTAQTATEVSLTTSLAQRRVAAKKLQFSWSQRRDGEHWIALNQQFLKRARVIEKIGADGAAQYEEIRPEMLQGSYGIQLESLDESLQRQERRAEKAALFQIVVNSVPVFAALAQSNPNVQVPNPQAFLDDVMETYGISGDKARYYSSVAPPPQALPAGAPQPGQPQPGAGAAQTAPQAYDMNAPSHATSQSPVAALQQLGAASGGMANAGG